MSVSAERFCESQNKKETRFSARLLSFKNDGLFD